MQSIMRTAAVRFEEPIADQLCNLFMIEWRYNTGPESHRKRSENISSGEV